MIIPLRSGKLSSYLVLGQHLGTASVQWPYAIYWLRILLAERWRLLQTKTKVRTAAATQHRWSSSALSCLVWKNGEKTTREHIWRWRRIRKSRCVFIDKDICTSVWLFSLRPTAHRYVYSYMVYTISSQHQIIDYKQL